MPQFQAGLPTCYRTTHHHQLAPLQGASAIEPLGNGAHKRQSWMERDTQLVAELSAIPTPTGATILSHSGSSVFIELTYTTKEFSQDALPSKRTFEATCKVSLDTLVAKVVGAPRDVTDGCMKAKSYSPDRSLVAISSDRGTAEASRPRLTVW